MRTSRKNERRKDMTSGSKVWFEQFASPLVSWEDDVPFDWNFTFIDQIRK
jgi:hypothetical protein